MIRRLHTEKTNKSPAFLELEAKLHEAEAELAGFRSVEDIHVMEIRELKEQLAQLQSQSAAAKGKSGGSDDELLKAALDKVAAKDREIAAIRDSAPVHGPQAEYFMGQLEAARGTIATLEKELLKRGSVNPAEHEALQEQVEGFAKELQAKDSELSRIKAQLDQLRSANDQALQEMQARAEAAEAKVARHDPDADIEALRRELEDARRDDGIEQSLRQDVEEFSAKLASREQMVTELRAEILSLNARLTGYQTELSDLRAVRSTHEAEVQSLRDELEALQQKMADVPALEARLADAAIELETFKDLKKSKEELQHRAAILEGELSEARQFVRQNADLKNRLAEAESAVFEAAHLRTLIKKHRLTLTKTLEQLEGVALDDQPDQVLPAFIAPSTDLMMPDQNLKVA